MLALSACDAFEDLSPSGTDMREDVVPGSSGTQVGQLAIDFTLTDTLNIDMTLSTEYPSVTAVVLYFTMWCPVCDSHMNYMRHNVVPNYTNVSFYFVDYVTGSVSASLQAQVANGYTDFRVLADTDQLVLDAYNATMGTTVVIDSNGIVQMNEDFKDGSKLINTLSLL
ncbi:MAG: redoxin domain-containing protein [Gammaproteobacteria bacterium]|nr:redoxin domain-containing protein [Gammaproteobacteria bacterium]